MPSLLPILAAVVAILFGAPVYAQSYPSKPITIIVPFGPGSATDTITRVVAQELSTVLKQSVVVENRVGATRSDRGAVCRARRAGRPHAVHEHQLAAFGGAVPDEVSLLTTQRRTLRRSRGWEATRSCWSYTPSIPATTVKELIAHAKANPGKLTYASANTSGVVAGATLKHWAKLDLCTSPTRARRMPCIIRFLARVSMMFNDFTTSLPHIQSKAIRALASTRLKRSSLFPELPTMDEAGVEGFDMDFWAGIFAPANTPQLIVTQLSAELRKIIDSADVKQKLRNAGFEAFSSSPQELDGFVKEQLDKWSKMVKDADIQPE